MVPLLEAENHHCPYVEEAEAENLAALKCQPCYEASSAPELPAVNRSTFTCPVCKEANLSRQGLLDHCNQKHARQSIAAVCPVCLAMPWADPSYVSQNFISHLNLRHQYDYDTIANFDLDEEAMIQQALQASLEDVALEDKPEVSLDP